MKRVISGVIVVFLILCFPIGVLAAGAVPGKVLMATESVVRIFAEYTDGYKTGSGFVIKSDKEGTLIATNYHVVEDNPITISVWLSDDEKISASVLAYTDQKDMCILELAYPVSLAAVRFANGVAQGEAVYAVGFPGAADSLSDTDAHTSAAATITDGIVSAVRQVTVSNYGTPVKMLQINAAINPGNSGGPLFNSKGEVVGIDTYGAVEAQGIYGAIDISELKDFLADNSITVTSANKGTVAAIFISAVVVTALCAIGAFFVKKRKLRKKIKCEKIPAVSLRTYMEKYPQGLGRDSAVSMLLPVALQLRDMHNDGESHLQISPDSVYVASDKAELGAPKNSEEARYTSGYAAPEIYMGKTEGNLSDIYSFCAMLQYAAYGVHPENSLSRQNKTEDEETSEGESSSDAFSDLLEKGMALSAKERYQTMQELIYSLSPYNVKIFAADTNDEGISHEKFAPGKERKVFARSKWGRVAITISAVLVVFVGFYTFCCFKAASLAESNNGAKAEQYLFLPGITKIHSPYLAKYVDAHSLMSKRNYSEAKAAFLELGEYKNSAQMALEADYRHAAQYADSNNYEEAIALFSVLSEAGYKDSDEKILETEYRKGSYTLYELGEYESAYDIFAALQDKGYEDAQVMLSETIYWWAFGLVEQENFIDAYDKFASIEGYSDSNDVILELKELLYLEGQTAYYNEDFFKALDCFSRAYPYSRSEDYITLLRCSSSALRLHLLAEGYSFEKNRVESLIEIFYFENAAELLLKDEFIAGDFLAGKWMSANGYSCFEIDEDGYAYYYGLPFISTYGYPYYCIEDGEFRICGDDEWEYKAQFTFTLISPDCMDVYCHYNGSTHTLYRR